MGEVQKIYLLISTFSMTQNHCCVLTMKSMGKGRDEERREKLTERTRNRQPNRKQKRLV